MQHHVGQTCRGFGHEYRRTRRLTHGQRKAAHVVLVRMGQHHGIKALVPEKGKVWRGKGPGLAWMHARIKQDTDPGSLKQVTIRPDLLGTGQIGEFHEVMGRTIPL